MKPLTFSLFLILFSFQAFGQSNGLSVYRIMQDHCVSCHSNANPAANLDLEGSSTNELVSWLQVHQNVTGVTPQNSEAAAKGDQYVFPGRADKSFLFRKLNNGLESSYSLGSGENEPMPLNGNTTMSDADKEIIRQWILFGARTTGNQFDEEVVRTYYDVGGQQAFPDGPPPAPAADEGFQIKMGPFFLGEGGQPGDELEFFQKWELDVPQSEVVSLDHMFSGHSHHFIIYKYNNASSANSVADGLRTYQAHDDINLVTAVQEQTKIDLPDGAAFYWDANAILDLNSHYINYSFGEVYKAETYLNVYTVPPGTASQEMHTELIANIAINIPNNEELITAEDVITSSWPNDVYLWGLMGHTHKYGRDYKVWTRENGVKSELIYDASCAEAVPGCVSPNFDYQHIPLRLYDPFVQFNLSGSNGLIHQASWLNDGPQSVFFGPTSDDEMMVLVMMYLLDTEGVNVNTEEPELPQAGLKVFPNPMNFQTEFFADGINGESRLTLLDGLGRVIRVQQNDRPYFRLEKNGLPSGIYFYEFSVDGFAPKSGKLVVN
ncbi:MAG: T9SS type A sorting domain-containing protein [Saprospiraceae bacterium]|nr:T9SS type A sorting domain-containing protein [Saprospiraceae bacterium]